MDANVQVAHVVGAAQQMMSFHKPTDSEHSRVMSYVHDNKPVHEREFACV